MAETGTKHQHATSWEERGFAESPNGVRSAFFRIGDEADPTAPTVFKAVFPPHTEIAPHTHACDYAEVILEGTERVGRTWYKAGDIRVVKANTAYGPLLAGPEGVVKLVIFKDARWQPIPTKGGGLEGLNVEAIFEHYGDDSSRQVDATLFAASS